jgi:hypothetical protein
VYYRQTWTLDRHNKQASHTSVVTVPQANEIHRTANRVPSTAPLHHLLSTWTWIRNLLTRKASYSSLGSKSTDPVGTNHVSLPLSVLVQCPLSLFTLPFLFSRLEDLVAHDDIISIITKLIDSDNLPHLLLYGPPGTGKVQLYSLAIQDCVPRSLPLSLSLNCLFPRFSYRLQRLWQPPNACTGATTTPV